jgi:hypothetical protein
MKISDTDQPAARFPKRRKPREKWVRRGTEPALVDVMNDPIVRLLMRRDHLRPGDVWQVIEQGRQAVLERRRGAAPALGRSIIECWGNRFKVELV